ncbi:hypothetical protein RF11_11047 [Thelohanellus kitauei]|uniref:Uncharacterized protein n=1 Tax=Thelohanellus kitauei TaxID=669202 RepID=A0A0C2JJ40_THEKT|nr:hypothetical protein RF11_11047 [Thelohanellus kitauei]
MLPKFEDWNVCDRNPLKPEMIRLIFDNQIFALTPKDGTSFREIISFLNISNKELLSYYAFVLPSQKIIEFSQNTIYYARQTVEFRRFALLYILLGDDEYAVKCPYDCPTSTVIDSLLSYCGIPLARVRSTQLKTKKTYSGSVPCNKYHRQSIFLTLFESPTLHP